MLPLTQQFSLPKPIYPIFQHSNIPTFQHFKQGKALIELNGGEMDQTLLNIGFGSSVVSERIVAIVSPNSAPMKRLKDEARNEKRLIDATHGRRTRSIMIMDSNHVVLSAIQAETISQRYAMLKDSTLQS
jgi:regulator of extracellular matrix RemA (YlzA/DUF370 family)